MAFKGLLICLDESSMCSIPNKVHVVFKFTEKRELLSPYGKYFDFGKWGILLTNDETVCD